MAKNKHVNIKVKMPFAVAKALEHYTKQINLTSGLPAVNTETVAGSMLMRDLLELGLLRMGGVSEPERMEDLRPKIQVASAEDVEELT